MAQKDITATEKALRQRERVKNKKPKFVRQESWRYRRLKKNWRRPRGLDNKMRRKIKGWPPTVSVGYRGPKATRNLHPSGYREVLLYNAEEIKKTDPKTQVIRIAHTVGKRKRTKILVEARKKKITVLNLKEAKEVVKEEKMAEEKGKEEILEKEEEAKETEETKKPKRKQSKKSKSKRKVEDQ